MTDEERVIVLKAQSDIRESKRLILAQSEEIKTLESTIQRMKTDAGYPTHEDMRERDAKIIALEGHVNEAMKLMRESGADEREYVVYAVLEAANTKGN
jgi:hypothetical protein